jgi:hypothetical protein
MTIRTYTLTDEEFAEFHLDERRGEIRQRAASHQLSSDTIHIVDSEGDVWDTLNGAVPSEEKTPYNAAPLLSPEEIAEQTAQLERDLEEAKRFEEVIRPLTMKRLRADALAEVRSELREKMNEVLELRATVARFELTEEKEINHLRAQLAVVQAENKRLKRAAAIDAKASKVEEKSS